MEITALSVPGAFVVTNIVHSDERGEFVEWFREDRLAEATGMSFTTAQANLSVSSRGTFRGIHFADVPPGQAKYVTCVSGSIQDFIVDIRTGSPSFGNYEVVELDSRNRDAVLLDVGLGHGFVAMENRTIVSYLVSDIYRPDAEHAINPVDPELGIRLPFDREELSVSQKDLEAPGLSEALALGILPEWKGGNRN